MSEVLFTHGIRMPPTEPGKIALPYYAVIEGRLANDDEVEDAKERERKEIERSKHCSGFYRRKLAELGDKNRVMFSPSGDGRVWARPSEQVFTDRSKAEAYVKERRRSDAKSWSALGSNCGVEPLTDDKEE